MINGDVSFWWNQIGRPAPRPPLPGSTRADVCIVGAGYTGLWAAYYLKKAAPQLRIVILEQRFAGYGASGRNGGWLTNSVTGGCEQYLRSHGRDAVAGFQAAMNDTVDEVIRVAAVEGIDADIVKGGEFTVAYDRPQQRRLEAAVRAEQAWPHTGVELLSAEAATARINVAGSTGAMWHPHCARIQPAKLVAGLTRAVLALGVEIYDDSRVSEITPQTARTQHGTVQAEFIVRATEGFTAGLAGLHRAWLPMNSSLIVTEPLPAAVWAGIGWDDRATLGDMAHAYMYAQRTADDRIAIGGRGVPYRFGSQTDSDGQTPASTIEALTGILHRFFPGTADAAIEHAWSGVLGVPRDWAATVGLDRQTGLAWAGGYVGTGVATTNLAGRTLTDLILGRESALTALPWVNHRVRNWEPEPLRWLAVTALYQAYTHADRAELTRRRSTSPLATLADRVSGRGH
ncbi:MULTISPECIES: FAD-binding oxidoreductase [unclassified Cryobacterium]|uniref:NAD(P)/FAD-dependent oxidoreductase n=1 Tax=unclassified Cryobacterium TaxID=2649013 RepID=UPI00106DAB5E|nr:MULTISPECIES: FAD-binding oxidoreductase [unclassified Cryobacterium]TFC58697.1 FAD-dependent oxidoreductase [Cryobacterium sp. TMB3-1-2]TFC67118.1 FAD-dependent oxidoreductase [Cryobacterium sp. TMB3-15]TFC73369.1 FAD-dependent oxidoreductase [Cryobacterium sp. TMB3-10]TFD44158.1 FAD-dependent oxidoreductase [Cryobacterium sp. TMB3-12]